MGRNCIKNVITNIKWIKINKLKFLYLKMEEIKGKAYAFIYLYITHSLFTSYLILITIYFLF